MARSAGSSSPLQPLNAGSIVSAAFQLYRSHLKQYLGIAWRATLWILLPVLMLIVAAVLLSVLAGQSNPGESWGTFAGFFFLLVLVSVILLIFCSARAGMNTALISRLAYGELVSQPEGVKAARQEMLPRTWRLFWAQVLVSLCLSGVNIGTSLIQTAFTGAAALVLGAESALASFISLVVYLVTLGIYMWFTARWSIPELPIAIENVSSSASITRSWDLSKGSAMRILVVLFVGFLVTLPLYLLGFVPLFLTFAALAPRLAQEDTNAILSLMLSFGVSLLLLLLLNVFIIPFWQSLKALIYYDLRTRREGLDLQLRERRDGADPV